jgi:hypothetical protein
MVAAFSPRDVHHFTRLVVGRTAVRLVRRRNVGWTQRDHLLARREVQHAHRRRVPVGEHARFDVEQQHRVRYALEQQAESPVALHLLVRRPFWICGARWMRG